MKIKKILPIIGLIILVYILFNLNIGLILNIFKKINPVYSFISFFAFVPLLLIANVEWQLILKKQKINVSFWYSIKNLFIGYFYGFITPGGVGAYTRSLYLSDESNTPLLKCLSNIIIFNTVEFIPLLIFGAIGAIFLSSIYPYLFFIILVIIVIVSILVFFFFKIKKSKKIFVRIIKSQFVKKLSSRLEENIESFYEDIPSFKDVSIPFLIASLNWLLKYIILFFIAKLFFIDIPIFYFIMIIAVSDVIATIPISIYGIGTREASLITMFTFFDPNILIEQIVSLSLFWFVIIWLIPSIIGAFVTFYETKKTGGKFKINRKNCEDFEKYMKKYTYLYSNLAKLVKGYVKDIKNPTIVDLGVGPGLLSKEINKELSNAKIIGIDPYECMLDIASKNAKIEAKIGKSDKIPIEEKSVDLVVSRFSLTYWENPVESFNEIYRILKPNGILIIESLNKDFPKYKLFFVKFSMFLKNSGLNVARYHADAYKTAYSLNNILSLFRKAGFKIQNKNYKEKDWKFIVVGKK